MGWRVVRVAGLWGVRARGLLALGGGHRDLRLARVLAAGLWGLPVRVLVAGGVWGLPVRVLGWRGLVAGVLAAGLWGLPVRVLGWRGLSVRVLAAGWGLLGVRRRDRLLPGRDLRGGSVRLRSR